MSGKIIGAVIVGQLVLQCVWAMAEGWTMGQAPIMTRWAKEVSPDNALTEYPRPQMVRKEWMNLNGVWGFGEMQEGAGGLMRERILVPYPMESALSGVMKHYDRVSPNDHESEGGVGKIQLFDEPFACDECATSLADDCGNIVPAHHAGGKASSAH